MPLEKYLKVTAAAQYCRLAKSTLDKLRLNGGGPSYSKIGRAVIYDMAELDNWLNKNKRRSTSEY